MVRAMRSGPYSKEQRQKAIKYGLLTIIVCVVLRMVLFDGPIHATVFALTQPGGWPDGYQPDIDGLIQLPVLLIACIPIGYVIGYPFAAMGLSIAIRFNVTSRSVAMIMGFLVGLLASALSLAISTMSAGPSETLSSMTMSFGVETSNDGIRSTLGWWYEVADTLTFALICSFGTFVMHRVMTAPIQSTNSAA